MHKEFKNNLFLHLNSKSSGQKMTLQVGFKKMKDVQDFDLKLLNSYGLSSGVSEKSKTTYLPI